MKWNLVPCKELLNLTTKTQFMVGNIDKLNLIRIKDFFQRVTRLKKKNQLPYYRLLPINKNSTAAADVPQCTSVVECQLSVHKVLN